MNKKIIIWIKRYLPAELVCTVTAILSASAVYAVTKNDILTAFAGTFGENVGFYSVMIGRDIYTNCIEKIKEGRKYSVLFFIKTIKNSFLEFGPAEILDSFFSRPFMMYIFPKITGNIHSGVIAGKIIADVIVYIPIIISYELQQKQKK